MYASSLIRGRYNANITLKMKILIITFVLIEDLNIYEIHAHYLIFQVKVEFIIKFQIAPRRAPSIEATTHISKFLNTKSANATLASAPIEQIK